MFLVYSYVNMHIKVSVSVYLSVMYRAIEYGIDIQL